jgi:hypothetical protein
MATPMKIEKEVMLPASVEEVWPWLVNVNKLQSIWSNGAESPALNGKTKLSLGRRENWKVLSSKLQEKISFTIGHLAPTVITSFEIATRGKRTSLKVVISGWEGVDPDRARLELPLLSLEWEKRLNLIKQAICIDTKNHEVTSYS